jgi:hypothetical protein
LARIGCDFRRIVWRESLPSTRSDRSECTYRQNTPVKPLASDMVRRRSERFVKKMESSIPDLPHVMECKSNPGMHNDETPGSGSSKVSNCIRTSQSTAPDNRKNKKCQSSRLIGECKPTKARNSNETPSDQYPRASKRSRI